MAYGSYGDCASAYADGLGLLTQAAPYGDVDPNSPEYNEYIQYLNTLWGYANTIELNILPAARKRIEAWTTEARAAGVHEANIISYLTPFNAWDQAMADLSGIVIPLEIKRIQWGGKKPTGDTATITAPYRPTPQPPLPSIDSLIAAQGGARTGTSQYTGPISPVTVAAPVLPKVFETVQVVTTGAGSTVRQIPPPVPDTFPAPAGTPGGNATLTDLPVTGSGTVPEAAGAPNGTAGATGSAGTGSGLTGAAKGFPWVLVGLAALFVLGRKKGA